MAKSDKNALLSAVCFKGKKQELKDFYNKRLSQVKFTRDSVAEIRNEVEAGRDLRMNISLLRRQSDPAVQKKLEKKLRQ